MSTNGSYLYANGSYLHDVGRLAEKLVKDFGALTYENFAEDSRKVESAVMRVLMMKEGCALLPNRIRRELAPIDWRAITGKWDGNAGCHVGFDRKQLWETIVQTLPGIGEKIQELLKGQSAVW